MRFLVDGYNVTMADDATRRLSREEQRLALVRRLAVRGTDLLGKGRITVVFDGAEVSGESEKHGDVEVVFGRGESADDVIVSLARGSREPIVLVSSDRELGERARAACECEVGVRGASALFEAGPKRSKHRGMRGSNVGMPKGANRITEELKRIWLPRDEE